MQIDRPSFPKLALCFLAHTRKLTSDSTKTKFTEREPILCRKRLNYVTLLLKMMKIWKNNGTSVQTIDMSASTYDGINMRWYQDVGSCRSTISKNAAEEITIVKKLIYYDNQLETKEPIDLGSNVWLTGNGGRVSVEFTCKFASTFTAKSDEIAIEAGKAVEGKLEASGSWADSLTLEYT